jgi:hypothetical protein
MAAATTAGARIRTSTDDRRVRCRLIVLPYRIGYAGDNGVSSVC